MKSIRNLACVRGVICQLSVNCLSALNLTFITLLLVLISLWYAGPMLSNASWGSMRDTTWGSEFYSFCCDLLPVLLDWHAEQPVEETSLGKPSCRFLRPRIWFPGHHPAAAAAAAKSLQLCPTLRPHRRQPTRLSRPWDSPGKNTGVGCHFLLQSMKVKSEVSQSCLTPRFPMDCSLPGSSIHGTFLARVLEWGAIAFSVHHPAHAFFLSSSGCPPLPSSSRWFPGVPGVPHLTFW